MAQELITKLVDDLDGSEATETVLFGLDGESYEIDLNAKNAAALRKAVDKYVAAARSANRPTGAGRSRTATRRAARAGPDPKTVRAWAHEHGIEVSSRGRLPADILDRYRSAGGS